MKNHVSQSQPLRITRDAASIIARALKKAVNDETFSNDPDEEAEAVRWALAFKDLANRRVA